MEKDENTLGKPDNYLLLLFGIEIIFLGWIFFFVGGKDFFVEDPVKIGILLPLGLLTFVSVFFGFIFSEERLMKAFNYRIQTKDAKFQEELKKHGKRKASIKDIEDWISRYKALREYTWFVNPLLWLFLTIFLSLLTILINFTNINYKTTVIAYGVHLGILTTFFLVTSVASLIVAYKLHMDNPQKEQDGLKAE